MTDSKPKKKTVPATIEEAAAAGFVKKVSPAADPDAPERAAQVDDALAESDRRAPKAPEEDQEGEA